MQAFKQYLQGITAISDQEFADSVGYFRSRHLKKGDFFVELGKTCRQVGFIQKGVLRTYYFNDYFEATTVCFCTENNFTGSFRSFIQQQPSNYMLQAIEDTQLLVIDYDQLQQLYARSMAWQNIGRIIVEKEYLKLEQYASMLNNESAREKYIRLLEEQPSVLQKAKVEDIASYLGVTRRTLSRIRKAIAGE